MWFFRKRRLPTYQSPAWSRHAITQEVRQFIYKRDGYKCVYCDSPNKLQIDHIHPRYHGGSNEISNLVTACAACNGSKSARILDGKTNVEKVANYRAERMNLKYQKAGKKPKPIKKKTPSPPPKPFPPTVKSVRSKPPTKPKKKGWFR